MTALPATVSGAGDLMEQVVIGGDLAALTAEQRVVYYRRVCDSMGLNWLTKPFDYIRLQGKLTLYARKDAADQLRKIHGVSVQKPDIRMEDDLIIVTVSATDRSGRSDADLGVVTLKGLSGEARANAILKAVTKAKRRVTLSLVGLGWLDESEVSDIPGAQMVTVATDTGEIVDTGAKGNGKVEGIKTAGPMAAPAWQGAFWSWVADYMQSQGMAREVAKKLYPWAKEQGHMKQHLGEYERINDAQADYMKAAGWFLKEQPHLGEADEELEVGAEADAAEA